MSAAETPAAPARCENCDAELVGEFCHRCGQPAHSPMSSVRAFLRHTLAELADLDSKTLRSARYLLTRPGHLTAEFVRGRRARYTTPLQVYLVAVALFFLTNAVRAFVTFDTQTRQVHSTLSTINVGGVMPESSVAELARRNVSLEVFRERFESTVTGYMPTFLIASVLLFAVALALFYRRQRRPYVAHAVFAMHWTAFFLVMMIVERLVHEPQVETNPVGVAVFIATLTYLTLALRRVYGQGWGATLARSLALFVVFQMVLAVWMLSAVTLGFAVV